MVTVTYVTPSEAAALFATTATASRSSAAAFIINNDTGRQISTDLQAQLSNNPSYIDRSQHPSPSFNQNNVDQGERKRDLQPGHSNSNKHVKKRQKVDSFSIDLSDVPPKPPILKPSDRIKEGASKYTGVYSDKAKKKWISKIQIDGKYRYIGYYEKEEEAAVDYARAVFKHKGQAALEKKRERHSSDFVFDLSDVPPQPPILKFASLIKEGASKYTGVCFDKTKKKWAAGIWIDGMNRRIGFYENEEEAAVDYARALLKYKGQEALDKARERLSSDFVIDLSDVPQQPPILKTSRRSKNGTSKYTGAYFNKVKNKWIAKINIDGKDRHIGCYENEEEAAADYARALLKYKV